MSYSNNDISLAGNPVTVFSDYFTVSDQPDAILSSGSSSTFTIDFTPVELTTYAATVTID